MAAKGFLSQSPASSIDKEQKSCTVIEEEKMITIKAPHAGILTTDVQPGTRVDTTQPVAHIIHPYEGHVISSVTSPCPDTVFFIRNKSIAFQNTLLCRIIPE